MMAATPPPDDLTPADPLYGEVIGYYPSDRLRLLMIGGGIYAVFSAVLNVAFWNVEATLAALVVVGGMTVTAIGIGWWVLHQWNREVILYERGFSYREGSRNVYFLYEEIRTMHYQAERIAYFGGLIRRTRYDLMLKTIRDERIHLTGMYRRIEELGLRLEQAVNRVLRPIMEQQLRDGHTVPFGDAVALRAEGLQLTDTASGEVRLISWGDYTGYTIHKGQLTVNEAVSVPVATLENPTLLLTLLQVQKPKSAQS